MTTYKGINGFAVQSVATDPSPLDEGQVWYNNASYAFKLAVFNTAAWASGGTMNTAREQVNGAGTQTAMIIAGGSPVRTASEAYNGSSWTNVAAYPVGSEAIGVCGTQTAALAFGGSVGPASSSATESWNGSSWTTVTSMTTARQSLAHGGTSTAALGSGGYIGAGSGTTATEEFTGDALTTRTITTS